MTLNHYLKKDFPFNEEPLFLRFRFLYSDQRSILLFYQILIFYILIGRILYWSYGTEIGECLDQCKYGH